MCIASVKDCRALAEAHPVEVTKANIPKVIKSQAVEDKKRTHENPGRYSSGASQLAGAQ